MSTARPYIATIPAGADMPRPAMRVSRVCELLDCGRSEVYRLIRQGHLEAFNVGGRSKRIYVDSLADYQRRQAVVATGVSPATTRERQKKHTAVTTAAARAAIIGLAEMGLIKRDDHDHIF